MQNSWTNGDVSRISEIIMRAAVKLGWAVDYNIAQTGTYYLTCTTEELSVIIRVATHADVYCNDTLSVDPGPEGIPKEDAVHYLAIKLGKRVPGWVTKNLNRKKELAKIRAQERNVRIAETIKANEERDKRITCLDPEQKIEYSGLIRKLELVRNLVSGVDCSRNNRKKKIKNINNKITKLLSGVSCEH